MSSVFQRTAFVLLAVALIAPRSHAADKEVIQLQQSVALLQGMIDRVNTDLPREAEPAAFFRPEQGQ